MPELGFALPQEGRSGGLNLADRAPSGDNASRMEQEGSRRRQENGDERMALTCHCLAAGEVDWQALDAFDDRTFSQRRCWLEFLEAFTNGKIIIAALDRGGEVVGFFTGIVFSRYGVPILGSPFHGWTTPYMGFNLAPDIPRGDALQALERFAFGELGCVHLEVTDRYLTIEEGEKLGFTYRLTQSYLSDLRPSEEEIFAGMASACRRAIRKSGKCGVTVEAASAEGFADEYYEQLVDVFAKQSLKPTYDRRRVQALIDAVCPSGNLLLARARDAEGRSIATGIYPGFNGSSFFWGNGSLRQYQILRPNEALHWFAMRYWRKRGARFHDWGGGGTYKAKYGGAPFTVPAFRKARYRLVLHARDAAAKLYYLPRQFARRRYLHSRAR